MNNTGQGGEGGGNLHRGLFMAACFYYESHFYSFCLYSRMFCFATLFLLSALCLSLLGTVLCSALPFCITNCSFYRSCPLCKPLDHHTLSLKTKHTDHIQNITLQPHNLFVTKFREMWKELCCFKRCSKSMWSKLFLGTGWRNASLDLTD